MKLTKWIASRMSGKEGENRLSKPVVSIAVAGVAVGVALIILSICIVKGFQTEVRNKVIGFGAHIQVVSNDFNHSKETKRLEINQPFYPGIDTLEGISHVQVFAMKPGILETKENIQGVVIKGVWKDYHWDFFEDKIVEGDKIHHVEGEKSNELLISKKIANRLNLEVGDKVTLYVVLQEGDIKPRNFTVAGLYYTGLTEFDDQFVFIDMSHLQKINMWGVEAQIRVNKEGNNIYLEGLGFGGVKRLNYTWDNGWKGKGAHELKLTGDSTIQLIVDDGTRTIPDTARVSFTFSHPDSIPSVYKLSRWTSGGSHQYYAGGFEIAIDDYSYLDSMDELVDEAIPYYLQTKTIRDQNVEIFSWLEMLDLNVSLMINLMVLISVVNMTSALLIIILERTQMIGLLKTFGMSNWKVMVIFIRHAAKIIFKGMLYGNLIGFGVAFLQWKFGLISLDPTSYYLTSVPVSFDFWVIVFILGVQLGTFLTCAVMMLLPAWYVARIKPVKAIRFD
ncbi:MAG: ABC transporter permease [Flavobacteriales bacterium]